MMSDETTTAEQLAEIEEQAADTPATEYTPPEGWRVLRFGEQLLPGDVWVNHDGTEQRSNILQWDASAVSGGRCIRRIEPEAQPEPESEPQPKPEQYTPPEGWRVLAVGERLRDGDVTVRRDGYQYPTERVGGWVGSNQRYIRLIQSEPHPQPQPEPIQVREGRWRTRGGQEIPVTAMPTDHDDFSPEYPWWHADMTWRNDGRFSVHENAMDLVEYLGPIEPKAEPQPQPNAAAIEELRSEVSYVQRLLGESRQRVTQLEELVSSLRTINDAQEKAVRSAGRENTDLQHSLDVVSKEWAEQAATISGLQQQLEAVKAELLQVSHDRYQLQIELDAHEQVPTSTEDRFEQGWDAGTARAVETIAEWTEPFRTCGSERLALAIVQNLPHIMRTLTGLTPED